MTSPTAHIVEFVTYLVTSLVDDEASVAVTSQEEDNRLSVLVSVAPGDVGKVIGRSGRTIKSIRTLARAAAADSPVMVDVDVEG